jgi:hypothetical protein
MSEVRYWQDLEMTIPAKDDGDRVAVVEDARGNRLVQPVFERRPTLKDGVLWFHYTSDEYIPSGKGATTLIRQPDGSYRGICGGQTMSAPERIAAALWREEAVDAGAPPSLAARRTPEAFADESDVIRAKWLKLAHAAIRAQADLHDTLRAERDALAARVERLRDALEWAQECIAALGGKSEVVDAALSTDAQ